MTLDKEVLKNNGFSKKARIELEEWMDEVTSLVNDIRAQYTAHIADDSAHNSADTTNEVTESAVTAPSAR